MKDPNLNRLLSHGIILLGCILFGVSCVCFGTDPLPPLSLLAGAVPFAGLAFSFFCRALSLLRAYPSSAVPLDLLPPPLRRKAGLNFSGKLF